MTEIFIPGKDDTIQHTMSPSIAQVRNHAPMVTFCALAYRSLSYGLFPPLGLTYRRQQSFINVFFTANLTSLIFQT